jgi:hypothetical protein
MPVIDEIIAGPVLHLHVLKRPQSWRNNPGQFPYREAVCRKQEGHEDGRLSFLRGDLLDRVGWLFQVEQSLQPCASSIGCTSARIRFSTNCASRASPNSRMAPRNNAGRLLDVRVSIRDHALPRGVPEDCGALTQQVRLPNDELSTRTREMRSTKILDFVPVRGVSRCGCCAFCCSADAALHSTEDISFYGCERFGGGVLSRDTK